MAKKKSSRGTSAARTGKSELSESSSYLSEFVMFCMFGEWVKENTLAYSAWQQPAKFPRNTLSSN